MIDLLSIYLSNRKQRVVINGSHSEYLSIKSGVPQGSVLGPLLFLIYINDLEKNIKSKIKFFADDTMLFSIVYDPILSAYELNHDLQLINDWAYQWKMSFNPEPNKQAVEILFSKKRNDQNHPPLFFNGVQVCKVSEHKHLGLLLDTKLSFQGHIISKMKLARKNVGMLKQLSRYLPLKTLDQIYKTFVRPHLDYCDVIYHIPPVTNEYDSSISLNSTMEMVERIQYQAAVAITGAWQGSNRNKLYEELGWESLSDRRWARRLFKFYEIRSNMAPQYLSDNIPRPRRPLYGNIDTKTHYEIHCRTSHYMHRFFPHTVKSWNNLSF